MVVRQRQVAIKVVGVEFHQCVGLAVLPDDILTERHEEVGQVKRGVEPKFKGGEGVVEVALGGDERIFR